jgi:hypothetical protein
MNAETFLTQYRQAREERDRAVQPYEDRIEALKTAHLRSHPLRPGHKIRLIEPDGDSQVVAVTDMEIDYRSGNIVLKFVRINRDGEPAESGHYQPQRGYTYEMVKPDAYPQFRKRWSINTDPTPADENPQGPW